MWKWIVAEKTKAGLHTACSDMPERNGKNQEEDSPKPAGSYWFARPCWLATSGVNLYPPGVWLTEAMAFFLWCCVCFVLFRFSLKPRPFVQSSFDMQAFREHTTCFFLLIFPLCFCLFGDVAFSEYFSTFSLYGEYVVCSYLPDGVVFYLVTTGWIFGISLCEISINQPNNQSTLLRLCNLYQTLLLLYWLILIDSQIQRIIVSRKI